MYPIHFLTLFLVFFHVERVLQPGSMQSITPLAIA